MDKYVQFRLFSQYWPRKRIWVHPITPHFITASNLMTLQLPSHILYILSHHGLPSQQQRGVNRAQEVGNPLAIWLQVTALSSQPSTPLPPTLNPSLRPSHYLHQPQYLLVSAVSPALSSQTLPPSPAPSSSSSSRALSSPRQTGPGGPWGMGVGGQTLVRSPNGM